MKRQINEPDFIGGQGSLDKDEELALSKYLAEKRIKNVRKESVRQILSSSRQQIITQ